MKTIAPAHAEQQLTHVADRFDHWRQTRTTPAEPIPQYLWEQAIALTTGFSISRVATRLRVSGGELKKRCAAHHAPAVEPSSTALGFVELSATSAWPMPTLSADLFGDALMLQLTPQSRIFVATEPVDFSKGIDGLAAVCRKVLGDNPLSGAVYVFRNRSGTALKILLYDGQGFWLCTKRLSQGRFIWWPPTHDASYGLSARELAILLWNGNPQLARMAEDWRKLG